MPASSKSSQAPLVALSTASARFRPFVEPKKELTGSADAVIRRSCVDHPDRQQHHSPRADPGIIGPGVGPDEVPQMSPTRDSTLQDSKAIITDLQCRLADIQRTLDQRTAEWDEAQRRLTERTAERDEALAREDASAEVLQVINSSPGDLTPVFDIILEKAHLLCGAAEGALVTYDGVHFHTVATRGLSEPYATMLREDGGLLGYISAYHPQNYGTAPGQSVSGARLVHVVDMTETHSYPPGDPDRRSIADLAGAPAFVAVPLRKDATLIGAIVVFRQKVQPFTDKQIALLQNFAAQAVVAMENARLLGELQQRSDEIAGWNRELEARVAAQVEELGRAGRLKRFLAPQLAELIVSQGDEKILESHRCETVVVFCDLRSYTAFTETAEPEEVLDFLRKYHGALGPLVSRLKVPSTNSRATA
jgi:GAF domain